MLVCWEFDRQLLPESVNVILVSCLHLLDPFLFARILCLFLSELANMNIYKPSYTWPDSNQLFVITGILTGIYTVSFHAVWVAPAA